VLFPALDAAMGGRCGPTEVMCHEHAQMRDALRQMGQAVVRKDAAAYLGFSETLLMLLQQHNHKEEHVLYTMADRVLASQSAALLDRLACP
jgi:hemerythrin-like domain-containing protein